ALLYYDYALTWTREVQFFWIRKPTLSTLLYFCCRYALAANVIYTLANANKLPAYLRPLAFIIPTHRLFSSCDAAYQISAALSVVGRFAILAVWGLRAYAVLDRNRWILIFFSSLALTVLVISIVSELARLSLTTENILLIFSVVPPELLAAMTTAYEVLSALVTTVKGCSDLRVDGKWRSKERRLTYLIMKQGLLYYGFVSLFSITALVLPNIKSLNGTFFERLMGALTIPVSGMMTARFLIHLRVWDYARIGGSSLQATNPIAFNLSESDFLDDFSRASNPLNDPLLYPELEDSSTPKGVDGLPLV
ncbi:hypothetical protein CPB83DRAFT_760614, partial [Crepidotus variabilis]